MQVQTAISFCQASNSDYVFGSAMMMYFDKVQICDKNSRETSVLFHFSHIALSYYNSYYHSNPVPNSHTYDTYNNPIQPTTSG